MDLPGDFRQVETDREHDELCDELYLRADLYLTEEEQLALNLVAGPCSHDPERRYQYEGRWVCLICEATWPVDVEQISTRERAMRRQCAQRRGEPGGCPCVFEHQCKVPTAELTVRLEAERERARALKERLVRS